MTHRTQPEITLSLTPALILTLWGIVPESEKFGTVETIERCAQQPDMIRLSRKKKSIVFSLRSFKATPSNGAGRVLDWQEIQ